MHLHFDADGHTVTFTREWFSGELCIAVDDEVVFARSSKDPTTHFESSLSNVYSFQAGSTSCRIEHSRPRLLGGFRRQTYRAFVGNDLVAAEYGY